MKLSQIAVLLAACAAPAAAGTVTLMSPAGVPYVPPAVTGNGASTGQAPPAAVSADGRWIAFTSAATNLVPGQSDANTALDVFLRDRTNGTTVLVSHIPVAAATSANGASEAPALSADGRWVAFASAATNLVAGQTDGNSAQDVFLFDRTTGQVTLLSHTAAAATTTANSASDRPGVAADGTVVSFRSAATDVIAGQTDGNFGADLFLYDVAAGTTALASRIPASATTTCSGVTDAAAFSADGRYVAIASSCDNLVTGQVDFNFKSDVFVHDRTTGTTVLASRTSASPITATNNLSDQPALSADGAWVAFRTAGTNLGASDSNGQPDVWAFNRAAGTTLLVSRRATAPLATGTNAGATPALSADGRFIAYADVSSNLVTGQTDANGTWDLFVFDRTTLLNTLASHASTGALTAASAASTAPTISADGAWVAYLSDATNLITGQTDANNAQTTRSDTFVFNRAAGTNALASRNATTATTTANKSSDRAAIAAGGGFVVFTSAATDVVAGLTDTNNATDVFSWERAANTNAAVSQRDTGPTSATANGTSKVVGVLGVPAALSADGRWAVVVSNAANVLAGVTDTNNTDDIFLFDRDTGAITLVSRTAASATTAGNGSSSRAAVSADGAWVAFSSQANNVVAGFTTPSPSTDQIYLWERATGTTILVSRKAGTTTTGGNLSSIDPTVSADGGVVAFLSRADDLVSGQIDTNNADDVFVFDRTAGTVALASSTAANPAATGNNRSYFARLSGDGGWVAFSSYATNLVPGVTDSAAYLDIFLYERATGTKSLVSHSNLSPTQPGAFGHSFTPSLSADGRFVAFESQAVDLLPGPLDSNNAGDVFVYDRTTGVNVLLSHTPAGANVPGDGNANDPQVSADGNWVVFVNSATNLFATPDANANYGDIVLWERATDTLTLVSHAAASTSTTSNSVSYLPAVSADGGAVSFVSNSTDLIAGQIDPSDNRDTFHWARATNTVTLASRDLASPATAGNGTSPTYAPRSSISADGLTVVFATDSSNLVSADTNNLWDAFLFQP